MRVFEIFALVLFSSTVFGQGKILNFSLNKLDSARQLKSGEEIALLGQNLDSQQVEYLVSGQIVLETGTIPAGTEVVVDSVTGKIEWVLEGGNNVRTVVHLLPETPVAHSGATSRETSRVKEKKEDKKENKGNEKKSGGGFGRAVRGVTGYLVGIAAIGGVAYVVYLINRSDGSSQDEKKGGGRVPPHN